MNKYPYKLFVFKRKTSISGSIEFNMIVEEFVGNFKTIEDAINYIHDYIVTIKNSTAKFYGLNLRNKNDDVVFSVSSEFTYSNFITNEMGVIDS